MVDMGVPGLVEVQLRSSKEPTTSNLQLKCYLAKISKSTVCVLKEPMETGQVGKTEAEKASSGENPKCAENGGVIASWAATDHLQKGCMALGVFQVSLLKTPTA